MKEIIALGARQGESLENYLKRRLPAGHIKKLFREKGVRLNGRRAKAGDPVQPGDRIQLYIPFKEKAENPEHGSGPEKLDVVYEDENLLVVNKPAGLGVHESKSDQRPDTVLGILENRYRESDIKPLLAHRLDKDTSGVLVVAKNPGTLAELQSAFETRKVDKQYLCLVAGRLPNSEGRIDSPLPGRDQRPAPALTRYRVIRRFSDTTLVRVTMETGRLHQIRLHFAKIGHPVVMDDQHGHFAFNRDFRKRYGLKRQFLHAEKLTLDCRGKTHQWKAPLSTDLEKVLVQLSGRKA